MTAWNHGQAAIATGKAIRIVEHLDVPPLPLSQINRILVIPMMMVLMKVQRRRATKRYMQGRMAKMIVVTDYRLQQRLHKRRIKQLVRPEPLVVPVSHQKLICLGQSAALLLGRFDETGDLLVVCRFVQQTGLACFSKHTRESHIAIPMKSGDVFVRRRVNLKDRSCRHWTN